jgi:RND family efflux transporter MFP subunit
MAQTPETVPPPARTAGKLWLFLVAVLILPTAGAAVYLVTRDAGPLERESEVPPEITDSRGDEAHVEVVKPARGVLERKTSQAGTVMAFDWVDIYAEVSGYLQTQTVDIGARVKKDDVLATVAVPERVAELEKKKAAVDLALAQVEQMKAAVVSARADVKACEARVRADDARIATDKSFLRFRNKQANRLQALLAERAIEARVVDEQMDRREAAEEAVRASEEKKAADEAQKEASAAKITQAEANLDEARQKVKVARAERDNAQVMVNFATIRAPIDGVITRRTFHAGNFIESAYSSSSARPLFTLQYTKKMRMVVPIPDRDVPYCNAGDPAEVEFDAIPGEKYSYPVARVAESEDLQTKSMRCEIDIPNPDGRIRQGMYGNVTITLAKIKNALTIPTSCLVGRSGGGKADVFVVRDGKAHLVHIKTGLDTGIDVEVVQGLGPEDEVISSNLSAVVDGADVVATPVARTSPAAHAH